MDIKYKKEYERKKWAEDLIKKWEKEMGCKLKFEKDIDDPKIKGMAKLLESVTREIIIRE